jgi:hypothetical protein
VKRLYRDGTRVVSLLICLLGVALVASTLARGGGPLALGVLVGVMFVLLGGGRFLLAGGAARDRR